jgi:molybdopterin-guanine dinucleotide biosynthesis protein B
MAQPRRPQGTNPEAISYLKVRPPSALPDNSKPLIKPSGGVVPHRALAVVGFSNCGKTELICKLLSLAQARGYRVAALKHSHKTLEVDQPGKDTWRFRQAGARAVALTAPGLLQVTHVLTGDPPITAALAALPGNLDFVLVEGYKRGPLPKIVFVPLGTPSADLPVFEKIIAYISDTTLDTELPVFSRDQAPEILDFILQWLKT